MRWNKKDFQSTNVGIILFNNLISWAWWLPALIWIGPRHTNYHPLGSICSFEPEDRTWQRGQLLITLLDLQVLWIVRHIFLRRFGRWPGRQVFHTSWERVLEQRPGELCGGCDSNHRYEECCHVIDKTVDPIERLFLFRRWLVRDFSKWSLKDYQLFLKGSRWIPNRCPPRPLTEYVWGYSRDAPSWTELFRFS